MWTRTDGFIIGGGQQRSKVKPLDENGDRKENIKILGLLKSRAALAGWSVVAGRVMSPTRSQRRWVRVRGSLAGQWKKGGALGLVIKTNLSAAFPKRREGGAAARQNY